MFEDSLFESSPLTKHNSWTTALSLVLQLLVAGVLVLVPLIYTQVLPEQSRSTIIEPPPPPATAARATQANTTSAKRVSELDNGVVRLPLRIPNTVTIVRDEETPASGNSIPGAIPGVPSGVSNAIITQLIRATPPAVPKIAVQKVRVSSGVAQGLLIREVTPQYPQLARQARIQGTVVLQAMIGKDGKIENLHVISGHSMLVQAAMEAVKQWRYKPYCLNGEPVDVDTQINVNFTLSGGRFH
jgi:periplasmic protein TonB